MIFGLNLAETLIPKQLKALDFFCGAGGMSYGLKLSGVKIVGGIDIDGTNKDTYEANIGAGTFHCSDIRAIGKVELSKRFGLKMKDDSLILVGCSPCQYWSKIQTNKEKSQAG